MQQELNKDELYFSWWFDELAQKGLAKELKFEPEEFDIIDQDIFSYDKFNKKGTSQIITKELFEKLIWNPDYSFIISRKLEGKMFAIIDENTEDNRLITPDNFDKSLGNIYQQTCLLTTTSQIIDEDWVKIWLDVKPPAHALQFSGGLSSSRDFRYLKRIMFERHKIYINKVVVKNGKDVKQLSRANTLFYKTFLPQRYKFTDKSGALRTLKNHEAACRNIKQYLEYKEVFKLNNNQSQQELF